MELVGGMIPLHQMKKQSAPHHGAKSAQGNSHAEYLSLLTVSFTSIFAFAFKTPKTTAVEFDVNSTVS